MAIPCVGTVMTDLIHASRAGRPVLVGLLASLVTLCLAVAPVAAELPAEQFEEGDEFGHEGVVVETHAEDERRFPADRSPAATQSTAVTTNGKDPPRRQADRSIDAPTTNARYGAWWSALIPDGADTRADGLHGRDRLATVAGGSDG